MGLDNIKLVYARWTHLPDPSFRLLGHMALVTMDGDNPPRYYGGRETMAFSLGRIAPPEPAASDASPRAEAARLQRRADFQAVKRALAPIIQVGAAALLVPARNGQRAEYGLYLDSAAGYAGRTPSGTPDVPEGYASRTAEGYAGRTPKEAPLRGADSRTEPGTTRGTRSPQVTNSPALGEMDYARAHSILDSLPDAGGAYMAQVGHLESMTAQVIAAAGLYLAERSAS